MADAGEVMNRGSHWQKGPCSPRPSCVFLSLARNSAVKALFLFAIFLALLSSAAFAQTIIRDEYWGGGSGKIQKDSLGAASEITDMEVLVGDQTITVTIRGPFFYNYAHHIKGAHKTPPGDLYISSAGWKVRGKAPYVDDRFTPDEGWDYVVSLFDKAVYRLDWSKIQWSRPKPGSVIYRRDQAWRGGYGGFVSWADIRLTDKSLVISFPLSALLGETIPAFGEASEDDATKEGPGESESPSETFLDIGLHWTMMCGNDVIEGGFSVPATIYSDYDEEAEEIPLPRPTMYVPPAGQPMAPWYDNPQAGTFLPVWFDQGGSGSHYGSAVPEPPVVLLLLAGLTAVPFVVHRKNRHLNR